MSVEVEQYCKVDKPARGSRNRNPVDKRFTIGGSIDKKKMATNLGDGRSHCLRWIRRISEIALKNL
jgi:hypothetical protein